MPPPLVPACVGGTHRGAQTGSEAPAASTPQLPPPSPQPHANPSPPRRARTLRYIRHENQPQKIHIKGLLRATANGNISPGTAASEQRGVEGKQAASPSALAHPPLPPPRHPGDPPPRPGTTGGRGVPSPRGTPVLGPLVPLVSLSINTRGDTAWLSPTPLPPPPRGGHRGAFISPGTPCGCCPPACTPAPPRSPLCPEVGGPPAAAEGAGAGPGGAVLTLPFKFADDGVQVGVLGGHMAPAYRHRSAALSAPGTAELAAGAARSAARPRSGSVRPGTARPRSASPQGWPSSGAEPARGSHAPGGRKGEPLRPPCRARLRAGAAGEGEDGEGRGEEKGGGPA